MKNEPCTQERIARALYERIRPLVRCDIDVKGEGVHWDVLARSPVRVCRIHCFSYDNVPASILLGMNPANQRSSGAPLRTIRRGAEYCCVIYQNGEWLAEGRTDNADEAIACVRAWIDRNVDFDGLQTELPFVDEPRRRMRELRTEIEPKLGNGVRCEIEGQDSPELWFYGAGRSCRLEPVDDNRIACTLWIGHAQVAYGEATAAPAVVVENWLVLSHSLAQMSARNGLSIEPHADVLESGNASRWHWCHVQDRIADSDDVLAKSRSLLEMLLQRSVVMDFYTYTSLYFLCFSASSHYPWVDDGLPVVTPPTDGQQYVVEIGENREVCTAEEAATLIEEALAEYPIRPFFGAADSLTVEALNLELAARGCPLRAVLYQRCQWSDAKLTKGTRACIVGSPELTAIRFRENNWESRWKEFSSKSAAVDEMLRWLVGGCVREDLGGTSS